MSLKLIELQVALPRTQDVGKMQEQMQQRGQFSQDHLANENQKESEKKRKQVNENEKTAKNKLDKDGHKGQSNIDRQSFSQEKEAQEQEHYSPHPYKGTFLDIEG